MKCNRTRIDESSLAHGIGAVDDDDVCHVPVTLLNILRNRNNIYLYVNNGDSDLPMYTYLLHTHHALLFVCPIVLSRMSKTTFEKKRIFAVRLREILMSIIYKNGRVQYKATRPM